MALPHAHGKFAKETKLQTPFHALATPANDIRKQTVVVHILHSPYRLVLLCSSAVVLLVPVLRLNL